LFILVQLHSKFKLYKPPYQENSYIHIFYIISGEKIAGVRGVLQGVQPAQDPALQSRLLFALSAGTGFSLLIEYNKGALTNLLRSPGADSDLAIQCR
jgi:hypothetical protein